MVRAHVDQRHDARQRARQAPAQLLEEQIAASGRSRVVLDTNVSLVEAIAMYQSCGYRFIDRYNDNPHADLWFETNVDAPR